MKRKNKLEEENGRCVHGHDPCFQMYAHLTRISLLELHCLDDQNFCQIYEKLESVSGGNTTNVSHERTIFLQAIVIASVDAENNRRFKKKKKCFRLTR